MITVGGLMFFGLVQIVIVGVFIALQPHPQLEVSQLTAMISEYFFSNLLVHVVGFFLIVIGHVVFNGKLPLRS
ncbi:MAG: hypothetical protein GKS07_08345 [Nitrosopumilus sp.]|nr:MAG: hypothetical protein GKS07_08345 [Nitrosopumilus sp.]